MQAYGTWCPGPAPWFRCSTVVFHYYFYIACPSPILMPEAPAVSAPSSTLHCPFASVITLSFWELFVNYRTILHSVGCQWRLTSTALMSFVKYPCGPQCISNLLYVAVMKLRILGPKPHRRKTPNRLKLLLHILRYTLHVGIGLDDQRLRGHRLLV